ncbi:MAG: ubiquinone/menaquinone biosynthesis methyltransferase [Kiritimatiellae bacterium]|nr:ubiquinone/menaquinone biosynthesis methyltransferase [Kiritimatiellia bacterium]
MNAGPNNAYLFNQIAARYDAANRLISLGRDMRWRRLLATHLYPGNPDGALLDVACGTGDQLLALIQCGCQYKTMTGLDPSKSMLEQARKKQLLMRYAIQWSRGSAEALPLPDASVDVVTLSFGLRNMADRPAVFRELRRVLKPSGRLAILEFSMPDHGVLRILFGIYLATFLPLAGGALTGRLQPYRYLARSIRAFPRHGVILRELTDAGFFQTRVIPVDLGAIYLYLA